MIKQQVLYSAVNSFIDREIAPLSSGMGSLQQFLFGFQLGVLKRKSKSLIQNYLSNPAVKAMQIVEGDEIDVELLYQALLEAMEKQGNLEVMGIKLTSSDVNKLYSIIRESAV